MKQSEDVWPWVALACLATAALVVVIVVVAVVALPAALPASAKRTKRIALPIHQRRSRSTCASGEVYDTEVSLCAPAFKAPVALDPAIMDAAHTAPCESVYRYACGKWIDQHVNENRAFSYAHAKTQARLLKLLTAWSGAMPPSAVPLAAFYASCVNAPNNVKEAQLEYAHMHEVVLGNLRTYADLPVVFGRLARAGYTMPFAISMERHPTRNVTIPLIVPDGFPDDLDEGRVFQIMQATRDLNRYTVVDQQQKIMGIMRVMRAQRDHNTRPLAAITDYHAYVDTQLEGDLMRFDQVASAWGANRWGQFFTTLDGSAMRIAGDQQVWCIGVEYMRWLGQAAAGGLTNSGGGDSASGGLTIHDWRSWIEFSLLYNNANFDPDLPSTTYHRRHDRRGPVGPGGRLYHRVPRDIRPRANITREQRCLQITQHMLPGLTARAYADTYAPEPHDRVVHKLMGAITATLREALAHGTPWMMDEDRERMVAKLDGLLVRVTSGGGGGVEPFVERIASDRYDHNMNMVRRYRVQRNLGQWHATFDRGALALFGNPLDVNAYYSPASNSITVLMGILQPPFYSPLFGDVTLYAILGSILGHETTHMLDSHGLYYDEYGSLHTRGILSERGMRRFFDATDCVVREYGDAPLGCEAANAHYGNSTLGEDMADLTGVALAYRALFGPAGTKGLTLNDKQRFFLVFAQAWCSSFDQEHLCDAVAHDEHAVPEWRVDRTLRNMHEFHEAFACREEEDDNTTALCAVY